VRGAGQSAWRCRRQAGRHSWVIYPALLLGLAIGGCTFCQDVKDEYRYRFTRPDSEKILANVESSGNDRAWALRYLDEPLGHGGNPAKQDLYLNNILAVEAAKGQDPLCRLEAIRTLGRYKDPRAVKALEEAYWNAKAFPAEIATSIRQQVLISLGQTANPDARELLIQVAKAGAPEDTQQEKAQTLDLRLCAIKGLGHFKQSDVTETLHRVMATEKDVALRDRAYLSLEESTGLRLPPDPAKWDKLLHGSPTEREAVARESSGVFTLVGWWQ
jgi:hypothetical protein